MTYKLVGDRDLATQLALRAMLRTDFIEIGRAVSPPGQVERG